MECQGNERDIRGCRPEMANGNFSGISKWSPRSNYSRTPISIGFFHRNCCHRRHEQRVHLLSPDIHRSVGFFEWLHLHLHETPHFHTARHQEYRFAMFRFVSKSIFQFADQGRAAKGEAKAIVQCGHGQWKCRCNGQTTDKRSRNADQNEQRQRTAYTKSAIEIICRNRYGNHQTKFACTEQHTLTAAIHRR